MSGAGSSTDVTPPKALSKKRKRAEVEGVLKGTTQWSKQRVFEELSNAIVRCAKHIWSEWLARVLRNDESDRPSFDDLIKIVCAERPPLQLRIVGDRLYFYDNDDVYVEFLRWNDDLTLHELGLRVSYALLDERLWTQTTILTRDNQLEYRGFALNDGLPSREFQDACADALIDWFAACSNTPEYAQRLDQALQGTPLERKWTSKTRRSSSSTSTTTLPAPALTTTSQP